MRGRGRSAKKHLARHNSGVPCTPGCCIAQERRPLLRSFTDIGQLLSVIYRRRGSGQRRSAPPYYAEVTERTGAHSAQPASVLLVRQLMLIRAWGPVEV